MSTKNQGKRKHMRELKRRQQVAAKKSTATSSSSETTEKRYKPSQLVDRFIKDVTSFLVSGKEFSAIITSQIEMIEQIKSTYPDKLSNVYSTSYRELSEEFAPVLQRIVELTKVCASIEDLTTVSERTDKMLAHIDELLAIQADMVKFGERFNQVHAITQEQIKKQLNPTASVDFTEESNQMMPVTEATETTEDTTEPTAQSDEHSAESNTTENASV